MKSFAGFSQKVELIIVSSPGKRARGSDIRKEPSLGQSENIAIDRVLFTEPSFKIFSYGKKRKK